MTDEPHRAASARATPPEPPVAAPAPAGGWGSAGPGPARVRPRSTSGRTAAGVLGIIVAVVLGANVVNAALPLPADPGAVDPGSGIPLEPRSPAETAGPLEPGPVPAGAGLEVGAGFTVYPPPGWTIVGGEDGLTVLQKRGVLLIVGGFGWPDTPASLAVAYRDGWFSDGQFTGDEPQPGTIGNDIPAAALTYTGVVNATEVDGLIVAGSVDGSGLVMNVFGASGSLDGIGDDVDRLLETTRHAGG